MSPLRTIPARRGVVVFGVVAAAEVLGYVGRLDQWSGVWQETAAAVGYALVFSLSATVAAASWISAGWRRSGLDEVALGASRSPWRRHGRELVEVCGWAFAGFLVGTIPAIAITAPLATYGTFDILSLAGDLGILAAGVAAGLWAGRVLPWPVAPPVTAAAMYAVLGVFIYQGTELLPALTPLDNRWMTFYEVPWWVPVLQLTCWGLLAAVFVTRDSRRGRYLALWLAGLAAAPLLYSGDSDRRPDDASTAMKCTAGRAGVTVCIPRPKAYLSPDLGGSLADVREVTAGLGPPQVRFVDDEARGVSPTADRDIAAVARSAGGDAVLFTSQFHDLSAYTQLSRDEVIVNFTTALFASQQPGDEQLPGEDGSAGEEADARPAEPRDVLVRWVFEELDVPLDGTASPGAPVLDEHAVSYDGQPDEALAWLRSAPASDREAWFQRNRAAIDAGELQWEDFGP